MVLAATNSGVNGYRTRLTENEMNVQNIKDHANELIETSRRERADQTARGTDRKIPCRCDAWYCTRRPTILTETFDFLCDEHSR